MAEFLLDKHKDLSKFQIEQENEFSVTYKEANEYKQRNIELEDEVKKMEATIRQ